jgi:hypothetical protein
MRVATVTNSQERMHNMVAAVRSITEGRESNFFIDQATLAQGNPLQVQWMTGKGEEVQLTDQRSARSRCVRKEPAEESPTFSPDGRGFNYLGVRLRHLCCAQRVGAGFGRARLTLNQHVSRIKLLSVNVEVVPNSHNLQYRAGELRLQG